MKSKGWVAVAFGACAAALVTLSALPGNEPPSQGSTGLLGRGTGLAAPTSAGARSAGSPVLEETECWVQLPGRRVSCGWVTVPLAPGSRISLRLAVLRVSREKPAAPLEPPPPPLLYLGGGPGHPLIGRVPGNLAPLLALAEHRDMVFVDPRGTGFGQPTLECKESGVLQDSLRRCHERHSVEVDPSEFTTAAGVRDLEAVRRALGVERWDVLATSYGARWALTLSRDAPQAVRAVVLDSPVPLEVDLIAQLGANAQRALDRLASSCASQAPCAESFPDVRGDLLRVAADLAAAPRRAATTVIDVDRFVRGVFGLLYAPATAVYLPQLLHRAARGDFELFLELEAGLSSSEFFLGAHLSAQCAEEVPFTTPEAVQRSDASVAAELRNVLSGRTYLEDCQLWRVKPAAGLENVAVRSERPTLILSGDLDPVTPPAYAEAVLANLPAARLLRVRGGSHGIGASPCGLRWIDAFLKAPGEPLAVRCPEAPAPEIDVLAPGGQAQVDLPLPFRTEMPGREELSRLRAAH